MVHTNPINPLHTRPNLDNRCTKSLVMNQVDINNDNLNPLDTIKVARDMWLAATTKSDLDKVERLYRQALTSKELTDEDSNDEPSRKKRKSHIKLSRENYRQASEKLALLLCQSGRCKKAKKPLSMLGFKCRLAERVLNYPNPQDNDMIQTIKNDTISSTPCRIIDGFLSDIELERLRSVFSSPSANYWTIHNYRVEPPSPYFSYVIPLAEMRNNGGPANKFGFIRTLIEKILSCPMLVEKFAELPDAQFVEMWSHNRPHASGHQMHFDSDDEGRGGVKNPIISTILYITACEQVKNDVDDCTSYTGGPSLVTNQKLESGSLATRGWLAYPKPKRLVAFDGRYLHGVVPGKGVSTKNSRRVTLMFAFWKDLKVRRGIGPGSARPFPIKKNDNTIPEWASKLTDQINEIEMKQTANETYKETCPIELDTIYEELNGKPWKTSIEMPSYDEVFQGF